MCDKLGVNPGSTAAYLLCSISLFLSISVVPPVMGLLRCLLSPPLGFTPWPALGRPPHGHHGARSAALAAAEAESWNHMGSPLSLNTHSQHIEKSCWIFFQYMPRRHLLLAALWLSPFFQFPGCCSGISQPPVSLLLCYAALYQIIPSMAARIIL